MSQILCIKTSFYAARVVVIHLPAPCARFRGGCHIGDVLRTRHKRDNVTTGFLPSVPLHHLQETSASPRTPQSEMHRPSQCAMINAPTQPRSDLSRIAPAGSLL